MIIIDPMEQRIFHGKITPSDLAQSLLAHFNRGNLRVQQIGSGDKIAVQIAIFSGINIWRENRVKCQPSKG